MFRPKEGEPPASVPRRMGTIVYAEEEKHALRRQAIDSCRALIVVGGGVNTSEEAQPAGELGVPVVPLAASGGSARSVWEQARASLDSLEFGTSAVDSSCRRQCRSEVGSSGYVARICQPRKPRHSKPPRQQTPTLAEAVASTH